MKTSIRTKLTALILAVGMAVIVLMWFMTVVLFKPMYYTMVQNELGNMMNKVVAAIDKEGGLTQNTLADISEFVNVGVCIEIANANGEGIVLFEGIGDACQLHGTNKTVFNFYTQQRSIDSKEAVDLRRQVRENTFSTFNMHLSDDLGNKQAVKGVFYNDTYTIIVSTNLTRTESIVSIVTAQLRTASIIALFISIVIAAVVSTWFLHPIMKLSKATKEIAKGNYKINLKVVHDDELGQLAQDFNLMAQEIERSQEVQKELIASISHDLRTPLTIIKGYAESIKDITGGNEQVRNQQLTTIIEETDRLSNMVGSVLDYAKLNQGAYKMNIVQFDIADMCKYIVDIYSDKAKKENKNITYIGPNQVFVMADAQLMERAIRNFVSNALLHTPADTQVEVEVKILENNKVRISVKDSGSGIKQEDIPHLFDKYYRARKDEGRSGTGLGLAIVKSIMQNHNFDYGVESEVGVGTTFWFEI